jgi:hypothetical protein
MRIVATARYINMDIHGSNNYPTMEVATAAVQVTLCGLQSTANLPPSPPEFEPPTAAQIKPEVNHACPPAGLPPYPVPFQPPWIVYNGLQTFHGNLQDLRTSNPVQPTAPSGFPPRPPVEPERTSGGGMPLFNHFPGLTSKGAGMFPTSSVREERPPVIVPSHEPYPSLRWPVNSGSGSGGTIS